MGCFHEVAGVSIIASGSPIHTCIHTYKCELIALHNYHPHNNVLGNHIPGSKLSELIGPLTAKKNKQKILVCSLKHGEHFFQLSSR